MLTAIIILALLSLLVATDVDPASAPAEPVAPKPVRPSCCPFGSKQKSAKTDRLAA